MKILESTPSRYDLGIKIITFGILERAYTRLLVPLKKGAVVLDIGCGTGALTLLAAQKGAQVKGIDINERMLEIARKRIQNAGLSQKVEFSEMGVAEMGELKSASFDAVLSGLCFSELTNDELHFALRETTRILKPGGYFFLADEALPENVFYKILRWLIRIPLLIITFIISQTTTRAVKNIEHRIMEFDLEIESKRLIFLQSFIELTCKKPEEK